MSSSPATLPGWVWLWSLVASFLVCMDCLYVLGSHFGLINYVPSVVLSLWTWYGESDSQYSAVGIEESNGWIVTQSIFNVFEVLAQLAFAFVLPWGSIEALLTILLSSAATLWKTLIYMSIIANSADPVRMVPGLACLGYQARPENQNEVIALLAKDNCSMQFFKFQFNIWWILVPSIIIWISCKKISAVYYKLNKSV
jgi:hypothetical protein